MQYNGIKKVSGIKYHPKNLSLEHNNNKNNVAIIEDIVISLFLLQTKVIKYNKNKITQGIIKYSKPLEFTKSHSIYFLKSTVDI